jgi:hypothetical protein
MEKLSFSRKAKLLGSEVYCEWHLENEGLTDTIYHAVTLKIETTVSDALDAYEPRAKKEINIAVQNMFPNMYEV